MPFAVFVAPLLSENAGRMIAAAARIPDVRMGVISMDGMHQAPAWFAPAIHRHWQVGDILDPGQLVWAAKGLAEQAGEPVYRLYGAYEQAQVPIAEARAALGVPGLGVEATRNFRDKSRMKDVLRAHGLPCARHQLVGSAEEAVQWAERTGYPLVVKPPAGAASVATFRVENREQLLTAIAAAPPGPGRPTLLEEFIVGTEHSLETISIGGRAVWHSLTHYAPTPLDVVRNPWIQWCVLLPREVDDPRYDDIKAVAARALPALGMTDGLTHMEWFRRRDGSVAIGEVGARPPGAQITTLVSRANDIDFLRAWSEVLLFGRWTAPERKYAVGVAFLRGQGQGAVRDVRGVERAREAVGALVCDVKLPSVGQVPTGSYEGEGYIIVRHPETAVVEQALATIVSTIRVDLA